MRVLFQVKEKFQIVYVAIVKFYVDDSTNKCLPIHLESIVITLLTITIIP